MASQTTAQVATNGGASQSQQQRGKEQPAAAVGSRKQRGEKQQQQQQQQQAAAGSASAAASSSVAPSAPTPRYSAAAAVASAAATAAKLLPPSGHSQHALLAAGGGQPTPSPSPMPMVAASSASRGHDARATADARFVFHAPPSLFRAHALTPPTLEPFVLPGATAPAVAPPAVVFPHAYAPTNLLRMLRALTPSWPWASEAEEAAEAAEAAASEKNKIVRTETNQALEKSATGADADQADSNKKGADVSSSATPPAAAAAASAADDGRIDYPLSRLWTFYDNPYGHEITLLLDQHSTTTPATTSTSTSTSAAAAASSSTASSSSDSKSTSGVGGGVGGPPDGTDVYFVPYLSALVLYERGPDGVGASSAEPSPPFLTWYERVQPYMRLPLIDQVASIATYFSPSPHSPLYDRYKPFPSARILQDLSTAALDLKRSWYAVTWYPILHDPLTTPALAGCFLVYHSFELNRRSDCPVRESNFEPTGFVPTPAPAPATTTAANHHTSNDVANGNGNSGGKGVASAQPSKSTRAAAVAAAAAAAAASAVEDSESAIESDGESESDTDIARLRAKAAAANPIGFPSHLCPSCGDRHGSAASASGGEPTPAYFPVLGYLSHRVLPSTWFAHVHQPAVLPQPQHAAGQTTAAAGTAGAAVSSSIRAHPPHVHPGTAAHAQHQLELINQFNALLHQTAPTSSFAHLTLTHQPSRLTHADLTQPMHAVLQRSNHPDYQHMTNTYTMPPAKERGDR